MRILWVKVGGLCPLNTGGRLRSFHTIADLSRRHRLYVLTTYGPGEDPKELPARLPHCERILSVPYSSPKHGTGRFAISLARSWLSALPLDMWKYRIPALRGEVEHLLASEHIDVCVADFLYAAANVPLGGSTPVVLFEHNVEHMIWKRLSETETRPWRRPALEWEWRKMRRYEGKVCATAALTVAVSETDQAVLAAGAPGARVRTIPTGVDTNFFSPNGACERASSLVFTGSMDWYPNEDAILHFLDAVLPRIRQEIPETELTVVGRNPSRRLCAAAAEAGVRATGTVEDVRPYVADAAVYVVPLRIGGGTRLKIFEALAMGKPVVATTVGAEGLPLLTGKHFLRADDPGEFARAVVALIRDPARRRALGQAGRRLIEEQYTWAHVAREFELRCEEAVRNHAS